MRGSEKLVCSTFDTSRIWSLFCIPHHLCLTHHHLSPVVILYSLHWLPASSLVYSPHISQRDPSKTSQIMLLVCLDFRSSSPYNLGEIHSSYHGLQGPPWPAAISCYLETLISLAVLPAAHHAPATLASLLFLELAKSTPTSKVFAAHFLISFLSLLKRPLCRDTFPVTSLKEQSHPLLTVLYFSS